jgi:hypothetical protein
MRIRSELTANGGCGADNSGGSSEPLVHGFVSDADGNHSTPVSTESRDDGAGLAGGTAEVEYTEEQFKGAAC